MPVFSLSCLLPTDLESAYQFHQRFENLPRVQPWWAPVIDVRPSGPPVPGTQIEVICGGLMRQEWLVGIEEVNPPTDAGAFAWSVDRAIRAPFPHWRHCHHFERAGNHTRMTDRVEFRPPLGPAGILLLPGIYLVFFLLFRHRHQHTQRILSHE